MSSNIYALIGVRRIGERTYYVKRSPVMANYPNIWSLLSIQFDPGEVTDPANLHVVSTHIQRLSDQRLGGVRAAATSLLISGDQYSAAIGKHVFLHLYEVELAAEPELNPLYYVDAAWWTPEQYAEKTVSQTCGLCLRLWASYAWMAPAEIGTYTG